MNFQRKCFQRKWCVLYDNGEIWKGSFIPNGIMGYDVNVINTKSMPKYMFLTKMNALKIFNSPEELEVYWTRFLNLI